MMLNLQRSKIMYTISAQVQIRTKRIIYNAILQDEE